MAFRIEQDTIRLDSTGFPMIWIEPGNFYMHWLPVTKIQLEYFLSSGSITAFNALWYDTVLEYNTRVTPRLITSNNYWRALLTGIKPSEIRLFAGWLGREYDLPTDEEWQKAYIYLKDNGADSNIITQLTEIPDLNRRAMTLIKNIEISVTELRVDMRGGRTVADQALMRMGVMEYVYLDDRHNTYGGYGQPNSTFFGSTASPDKPKPERLIDEHEGAKMPHYGFRLIKRGK